MAPPKIYDINANRGAVLYVSVWVMAGITILVLLGRFTSRKMKGQSWLIDDWAALAALILALGCCICSTISVSFGIGRHLDTLHSSFSPVPFWKLLYAYNQIYVMTGPMNKIAMLLMYRRIFDTPFFQRVVVGGVITNIIWWFTMSVSGVFTCVPVQAYWLTETPGKKCFNLLQYDLGYAIINIALDVFILILPIQEVWKLQVTRPQKIAISFIFLIGGFACVTALIRLLSSILYVNDPDFTWVYLEVMIWTAIEPLVSVICLSLPILRPVLSYVLPRRFTLSSYSRSAQNSAPKQQKSIITIGSYTTKKRKKTDELGFTLYEDDEETSQKELHTISDPQISDGSERGVNAVMVRHSVELS